MRDYLLQNQITVYTVFGRNQNDVVTVKVKSLLYLFYDHVHFGRLQIDFIYDWYDLQAGFERQEEICKGLSLNALCGIDDQQATLANRQ
jgi:hypothetical protein